MQKRLLFLALSLFTVLHIASAKTEITRDSGYSIQIKLTNYTNDTLFLGYQMGNQSYIKDTAFLDKKSGEFTFKGKKDLEPGAYIVILRPANDYFQIMINEHEQKFYFYTDGKDYYTNAKTNSADNTAFLKYMNYLNDKRKEADKIVAKKDASFKKDLEGLDVEVKAYQQKVIEQNPKSVTSLLIKSAIDVQLPKFPEAKDSTELRLKEYYYYKQHYFDNYEMSNRAILRTPVLAKQLDTYIEKLTPQQPDSINESLDRIFGLFKDNKDAFQYYFVQYLNQYAKSNLVGFDAVYVHLALKYIATGQADAFIEKDNREKIIDNAARKEPTLIGKKAPNIKTYLEDGKPIELYDIKAKYTIMFFYAYDCGHCQKQSPVLVDFYKKAKEKNLDIKVITISTKKGEENIVPSWKYTKEKQFDDFINTNDPFTISRYSTLYDIQTTPQLYVLDENKVIRSKGIEAKQLDEVIDYIMKEESDKITKTAGNK